MAVRLVQPPPVTDFTFVAGTTQAPAPPATPTGTAATGNSGKPLVRPELGYLAILVAMLVAGAVLGAVADDGTTTWTPGPGISAFAMIFVLTSAIERLIEIFAPFFGATTPDNRPEAAADAGGKLMGKRSLVARRDEAFAKVCEDPSEDEVRALAWHDELLQQVSANRSTLWAAGAMLGMVASGAMGILLLRSLGVTGVGREVDIVVTGLVVGGGTKAVHELISSLQATKETKKA